MRTLPLLFITTTTGWLLCQGCADPPASHRKHRPASTTATSDSKPDSLQYAALKKEILRQRKRFSTQLTTSSANAREYILDKVRLYWVEAIGTQLFQAWEGTLWDYNGHTTLPQKGSIACGYFVTTLLTDMGHPVDRIRLAICPSMTMMKKLSPETPLLNLSYLSYDQFVTKIRSLPSGVFIIGLDFHTGFIIQDGHECWFLHSNYMARQGVVREKLPGSRALMASKTRFVMPITQNNAFLLRWLEQ